MTRGTARGVTKSASKSPRGETVKPIRGSKLSARRMRNTNLLQRVRGVKLYPAPTLSIGCSSVGQAYSKRVWLRDVNRQDSRLEVGRYIVTPPNAGDLQHARNKGCGRHPNWRDRVHVYQQGKVRTDDKRAFLDVVRIGRVPVVVGVGESPSQGEGEQFRWFACRVTDLMR